MTSSTTTVRRPNGIPDSNAAEQIARLGGPVASRRSTQTQQHSPVTSQPTNRPPATADVTDMEDEEICEVASYVPPRNTTRQQEQGPAPLTLRASLPDQHGGRAHTTGSRPRQPYPQQQPAVTRTRGKRPASHSALSFPWRDVPLMPLIISVMIGLLIVIVGYTLLFWLDTFGVQAYNRWNYGPTPTFHLDAMVGDKDSVVNPTHFTATVLHGEILIFVFPGNDLSKAKSYVGPTLETDAWGNLDHLTVTLDIEPRTGNVLVHVTGDPNFWHMLQRPSVTYTLINTHPGFKIGTITNQAGN